MKKSFLMLGAALVALTSCTQSEVLEVAKGQEKMIGFESFVDKQTRVVNDITNGDSEFAKFLVYCAKGELTTNEEDDGSTTTTFNPTDENAEIPEIQYYLNNVAVTGGEGNWTYHHVPWIVENRKATTYRFAAYANGKGNADGGADLPNGTTVEFIPHVAKQNQDKTKNESIWGLDIKNYTAAANDLIIAIPQEKTISVIEDAPLNVNLVFKHALAQVIFQIRYVDDDQNATNNPFTLEIEPFEFTATKTANCVARFTGVADNSVIGVEWNNTDIANHDGTYSYFPQIEGENQSFGSGSHEYANYVIPQEIESLTIDEIVIHTKKGEGITSTKTYENISLAESGITEWLPGYKYRYIADINPEQHYIHFTTTVTPWKDETTDDSGIRR